MRAQTTAACATRAIERSPSTGDRPPEEIASAIVSRSSGNKNPATGFRRRRGQQGKQLSLVDAQLSLQIVRKCAFGRVDDEGITLRPKQSAEAVYLVKQLLGDHSFTVSRRRPSPCTRENPGENLGVSETIGGEPLCDVDSRHPCAPIAARMGVAEVSLSQEFPDSCNSRRGFSVYIE
jgi:hypothetical protein